MRGEGPPVAKSWTWGYLLAMNWKASPRTSLALAFCASLILPACGDGTSDDETGTGSNTESKDTASGSSETSGGSEETGSSESSADSSSADTKTTEGGTETTTTSTTGDSSDTATKTDSSSTDDTSSTTTDTTDDTTTGEKLTFKKDILPLITDAQCGCHRGNSSAAGLDLNDAVAYSNLVGANKNSQSGVPFVKAGDAEGSYLYQSMNHTTADTKDYMPKGKDKRPADEIKKYKDWIDGGAVEE